MLVIATVLLIYFYLRKNPNLFDPLTSQLLSPSAELVCLLSCLVYISFRVFSPTGPSTCRLSVLLWFLFVVTVKLLFGFEMAVRGLVAIPSWAKDVWEGSYKGESVATESMSQKGKMKILSQPRWPWLLDAASVVMGIGSLVFSSTAFCGLIVNLVLQ